MSETIRLLIADDQGLVRGALAALLNQEPDLTVVAEVERGDHVLDALASCDVDVALLDIEMPGLDGIGVVEQLAEHQPLVRSLIVTTFGRPGYLRRALDAGASGFVVKDTPAAELAEAVRRVHQGLRVIDPELAAQSLIDGNNPLTDREREALNHTLNGTPVTDIAKAMSLSVGTVRNYLSNAVAHTGAASSSQAAVIARERGWL